MQILGFGKMATYHANNEYCLLSDFAKGETGTDLCDTWQ